jgi:hypothetical protein
MPDILDLMLNNINDFKNVFEYEMDKYGDELEA